VSLSIVTNADRLRVKELPYLELDQFLEAMVCVAQANDDLRLYQNTHGDFLAAKPARQWTWVHGEVLEKTVLRMKEIATRIFETGDPRSDDLHAEIDALVHKTAPMEGEVSSSYYSDPLVRLFDRAAYLTAKLLQPRLDRLRAAAAKESSGMLDVAGPNLPLAVEVRAQGEPIARRKYLGLGSYKRVTQMQLLHSGRLLARSEILCRWEGSLADEIRVLKRLKDVKGLAHLVPLGFESDYRMHTECYEMSLHTFMMRTIALPPASLLKGALGLARALQGMLACGIVSGDLHEEDSLLNWDSSTSEMQTAFCDFGHVASTSAKKSNDVNRLYIVLLSWWKKHVQDQPWPLGVTSPHSAHSLAAQIGEVLGADCK